MKTVFRLANVLGMGLKPANHEFLAKEKDYQLRKNDYNEKIFQTLASLTKVEYQHKIDGEIVDFYFPET